MPRLLPFGPRASGRGERGKTQARCGREIAVSPDQEAEAGRYLRGARLRGWHQDTRTASWLASPSDARPVAATDPFCSRSPSKDRSIARSDRLCKAFARLVATVAR